MNGVRFPTHSQRTAVIGRTGTGKTQAGLFHLSGENFSTFPWLITDIKGDMELIAPIASLPLVKKITLRDNITEPGLYYLRAMPHEMKSQETENFFWRIHARGNVGLFFDEGYLLNKFSDALTAIYTQGRSLQIPVITCIQKPKYVSQFMFSECEFFQVFSLNDKNDRKRVAEFTAITPEQLERRLPDYHSLWYDVGRNSVHEFSPVPPRDRILENFALQLRHQEPLARQRKIRAI